VLRNVPDALHRRLKSRAALAGMSLSDYLLSEIRQLAELPTIDEPRAPSRWDRHRRSAPNAIVDDHGRCFGRARSIDNRLAASPSHHARIDLV
jgi:hypothetical protein